MESDFISFVCAGKIAHMHTHQLTQEEKTLLQKLFFKPFVVIEKSAILEHLNFRWCFYFDIIFSV